MDNTQIPSFEIPKSTEKVRIYEDGAETGSSSSSEFEKEILPTPAQNQAPMHSPAPIPMATNSTATATSTSSQPVTLSDDSHIIADDVDVIEKEWVDRAKKIVSLTSDDPFVETKEIGKLKASYMKKRFDKDIPLPQDGDK
jgi:hypothetical protein